MQNIDLDFERIHQKHSKLSDSRPLPSIALEKIRQSLYVEWTYHSNSIEGNSLTLRETQMVLEEGITIKGKSLREHFEIKNHEDAINLLEGYVERSKHITENDILDIHSMVLRGIEQDFAGRYRNSAVRIVGANFSPPNSLKVPDFIKDLLLWVKENPDNLNEIQLATVFHHRFVWVHPFFDGNGRTVRLLMNLFLMKKGYPPAVILQNDRKKYYGALNQANKGNYQKLLLLVSQAIERSLDIYLSAIPSSGYEGYEPISSVVQEPEIPYGQEYVSLLARNGKIDAFKNGRNWVTRKEAVIDYMNSKSEK